MKALTDNVQILRDKNGNPAFVVMPVSDYEALVFGKKSEDVYFPIEVSEKVLVNGYTLVKAWREYLELSQEEMAKKLKVTQGNYSKLEARKTHKKETREKLAEAFGISVEQLEM